MTSSSPLLRPTTLAVAAASKPKKLLKELYGKPVSIADLPWQIQSYCLCLPLCCLNIDFFITFPFTRASPLNWHSNILYLAVVTAICSLFALVAPYYYSHAYRPVSFWLLCIALRGIEVFGIYMFGTALEVSPFEGGTLNQCENWRDAPCVAELGICIYMALIGAVAARFWARWELDVGPRTQFWTHTCDYFSQLASCLVIVCGMIMGCCALMLFVDGRPMSGLWAAWLVESPSVAWTTVMIVELCLIMFLMPVYSSITDGPVMVEAKSVDLEAGQHGEVL